jgi:hypothetical protein
MSRQRTVTQIDAKPRRLLAGFVARALLLHRGEGRGAYYVAAQQKQAVARSNGRPPVSRPLAPDSGREGGPSRTKKGEGRQ